MTAEPRNSCMGCRHYYITYDTRFPYGCQLLGFKSKRQPVVEVIAATAKGCHGFTPRKNNTGTR